MSLTRTLKLALAGGIVFSTAAWASGPSPMMLSQSCAACHGSNGSSVGVTPTIAGADPEYFVEAMNAFKSGERKATVMDRVAKGYTEDEIKKMAEYFAQQPAKPMKQDFSPVKAKRGAELHEEFCEKCHEEGGSDSEGAAVLAGQSMLYLNHSLADFKAGHRETPKKMRKKVKSLIEQHGPGALEEIVHYYGSKD